MSVSLQVTVSDANVDATQPTSQRQLAVAIAAQPGAMTRQVPLNLCFILDHSGSMNGQPLEIVKQAAIRLIDRLSPTDRVAVVAFDHKAKVLVPNQALDDPDQIKAQIERLQAGGGTAIDEGLRVGIEELTKGRKNAVSHAFLLTDGENEHGNNDRCLKLAHLAAEYNLTLNALGFGSHWNQDVLEQIADAGSGSLTYIQFAEEAVGKFGQLFDRMQAVGLTNAQLLLSLLPGARLAETKPLAQVAPEAIELSAVPEAGFYLTRLGDLMVEVPRVVLVNLYLSQLATGTQTIANLQVRYDDPASGQSGLTSDLIPVTVNVTAAYQPAIAPAVQQHILALGKYRQTQIAETKLKQGDRTGAATMLQSAAKTALQMGDQGAATVLQESATRLQAGEELSESDRKKTRMVSKTILQE